MGNRLRPLTGYLPKPLVPLYHKPLAAWAMAACTRTGIEKFAVNTHHLAQAWDGFGNSANVTFFHEPILLETGGGLKNIASWIGADSVLVHNGDIFSTLPLASLITAHEASGLPVTLALRSVGDARHIALDPSGTRVIDIREKLGRALGSHVFSGIYCINPSFLEWIPAGEAISVIPAFLKLAAIGQLGAIILDDGVWLDLGDRESYLRAHSELALGPAIHPQAKIETGATIERSVIGPGVIVETGSIIRDSVIWPNKKITRDAVLEKCIVFSHSPVSGNHLNADL